MSNYVVTADIKQHLPDIPWSSDYDGLVDKLIERASNMLEVYTKRAPGSYKVETASIRYFKGCSGLTLWVDEFADTPTQVQVMENGSTYTTWASTDYYLEPYNAVALGKPYTRLVIDQINGTKAAWYNFPKSIKITVKWGYSLLPPSWLQEATIIQTVRWLKRGQQAFTDTGAIPELGQLTYTKELDPEVKGMIVHFRRLTI